MTVWSDDIIRILDDISAEQVAAIPKASATAYKSINYRCHGQRQTYCCANCQGFKWTVTACARAEILEVVKSLGTDQCFNTADDDEGKDMNPKNNVTFDDAD